MYVDKFEKLVRGIIFGSYGSKEQWSLPVEKQTETDDNTKKIGTINMEKYKFRKCVYNIYHSIDIYIIGEKLKRDLKLELKIYINLMKIMRKRMVITLIMIRKK